MATIKVFSSEGVKELQCFDTLSEVPFLEVEDIGAADDTEAPE